MNLNFILIKKEARALLGGNDAGWLRDILSRAGGILGAAMVALFLWGVVPAADAAPGDLVVTPEAPLTGTGFPAGPFSVQSQVYTLNNSGSGSLNWSLVRNRPWISLSASGGTLEGGASLEVTVLVNSRALELGVTNDTATLTFFNQTDLETILREITLDISLPGAGSAAAQTVEVTDAYQITVTGAGTEYVVEEATGVTGPWTPVVTNDFVSGEGVFDFSVAGVPTRYYRAESRGSGAAPASLAVAQVIKLDDSVVQVTGEPNGVYVVEASTNTVDWVAVNTNKLGASGEYVFTNTVLVSDQSLEYRAVAVTNPGFPTIRHVLIAGESLALGLDGTPVLSVTPSESNYRFRSQSGNVTFNRLAESGVETIASGAANHVVSVAPLEKVMVSNIGQNGAGYEQQKKGTLLYGLGTTQFRDGPQAAANHVLRHAPAAIFVVGGYADDLSATYGQNIQQWQADYQKDIQYLTGYTGTIPMFHSQISERIFGSFDLVLSPLQVLAQSEANPTKTILVCPKYFLPHAGPGALFPGFHLTNEGYRWLGEYYGKAYKAVVVDGGVWTPLRPAALARAGTTITAVFDVPVPPLVLDTTLVSDPGNYGFAFHDDSGAPPAIVGVSVTGSDTVEIELSAEPTGGNARLRYAYQAIGGSSGGPTSGPRGNLRDSDATPSLYGNPLYNWCVHFDKPVN